jgi:large subunit ribosomal protein L24
MKVKRGDTIRVITGKDKGKTGKIVKAIPREERVVVEGVNMRKKHLRARRGGQKGQIVEFAAPIHVSNVKKIEQ